VSKNTIDHHLNTPDDWLSLDSKITVTNYHDGQTIFTGKVSDFNKKCKKYKNFLVYGRARHFDTKETWFYIGLDSLEREKKYVPDWIQQASTRTNHGNILNS